MIEAAFHFPLSGRPGSCQRIGTGHIHETYLVSTEPGARYIVQRLNTAVFPQPKAMMENYRLYSAWLREHAPGFPLIRYLPCDAGELLYTDSSGACWRAYPFVPESGCLQQTDKLEALYQSAYAFGRFIHALRELPPARLTETIPHFHDTLLRFRRLCQAAERDCAGRRTETEKELTFAFAREERGGVLQALRERGELPVRVTHNDAKLNNVLLHTETGKAITVIDLDTVMPGLAAWDFGDLIRSGISGYAEDTAGADLLDSSRFRALLRGYLDGCPDLCPAEIQSLIPGAWTMILECGVRFLTDYLEGDVYFAVQREKHNLDRAKAQFALLAELERREKELNDILCSETKKLT